MDGRPTWTDCDEAGDYVVPNVLSPRDLFSRPEKMDDTVVYTHVADLRCTIASFSRMQHFFKPVFKKIAACS